MCSYYNNNIDTMQINYNISYILHVKKDPFIDGNKRTDFLSVSTFLYIYDIEIEADSNFMFDEMISMIEERKFLKENIAKFLEKITKK